MKTQTMMIMMKNTTIDLTNNKRKAASIETAFSFLTRGDSFLTRSTSVAATFVIANITTWAIVAFNFIGSF